MRRWRITAVWALLALVGCGGSEGFRPPGRCVPPMPSAAGETSGAPEPGGAPRVLPLDLDGDRAPDSLVTSEAQCDRFGNCPYRVHLDRGTCGHVLGALWAARVRVSPSEGPLADLVATTRDAKGEYEEMYRFERGTYRCVALRERHLYRGAALDPQAPWGPWRGC